MGAKQAKHNLLFAGDKKYESALKQKNARDDFRRSKRSSSAEMPRQLRESGGMMVKPGGRGSRRHRSVTLDADLGNERTYAVEPQEILVEHLEGEPLGGHFLGIDAPDLPGMPVLDTPATTADSQSSADSDFCLPGTPKMVQEVAERFDPDPISSGSFKLVEGDLRVGAADSSVALAVLLSIEPSSPIALFADMHPGVLTVGTVILQAAKVSSTTTSLTIGRWGWTVVVQADPDVPPYQHPGALIEAHRSFARIGSIDCRGSVQKGWNRKNNMAAVRNGDCIVAVNGTPIWRWLEDVGDDRADGKLNQILREAGERQEWVVVRVPGSRHSTGNFLISEMIQETLSQPGSPGSHSRGPESSQDSDGSPRNAAFRASLSLGEPTSLDLSSHRFPASCATAKRNSTANHRCWEDVDAVCEDHAVTEV